MTGGTGMRIGEDGGEITKEDLKNQDRYKKHRPIPLLSTPETSRFARLGLGQAEERPRTSPAGLSLFARQATKSVQQTGPAFMHADMIMTRNYLPPTQLAATQPERWEPIAPFGCDPVVLKKKRDARINRRAERERARVEKEREEERKRVQEEQRIIEEERKRVEEDQKRVEDECKRLAEIERVKREAEAAAAAPKIGPNAAKKASREGLNTVPLTLPPLPTSSDPSSVAATTQQAEEASPTVIPASTQSRPASGDVKPTSISNPSGPDVSNPEAVAGGGPTFKNTENDHTPPTSVPDELDAATPSTDPDPVPLVNETNAAIGSVGDEGVGGSESTDIVPPPVGETLDDTDNHNEIREESNTHREDDGEVKVGLEEEDEEVGEMLREDED